VYEVQYFTALGSWLLALGSWLLALGSWLLALRGGEGRGGEGRDMIVRTLKILE
jgi:hypothetical protein